MEASTYGARAPPPTQTLLNASLRFLDKQFRAWMESHLESAQLGGRPGLVQHVRAFLSDIVFREGFPDYLDDIVVDGVPLWAQLFYCLRCGGRHEAVELLADASRRYPQHPNLAVALIGLVGLRDDVELTEAQMQQLRREYNVNARDSTDPFKAFVYNALTRGQIETYETLLQSRRAFSRYIAPSTLDYIWCKLMMLRDLGSFQQQKNRN